MSVKISKVVSLLVVSAFIAGCGGINSGGSSAGSGGGLFKRKPATEAQTTAREEKLKKRRVNDSVVPRTPKQQTRVTDTGIDLNTIFNPPNDDKDIRVNKYIWSAALETLSFLPIEAADPFTGVLVLGWGRAPGSNTQFRATVLIQDPALEASSLKVAMQKRNGPASVETNKRIEDAILTRARQLRIAALKR